MNIKAFFVDALTSALDLNIGTPEDVLRHVTPDVLSVNIPRPLWARLLTACLGAPRVSPTLIVETIGIANLCEHVPSQIIWACIADIASRALGKSALVAPPPDINDRPTATGAPVTNVGPVAIGPSISTPTPVAAGTQPLQDLITELEQTDDPRPGLGQLRQPRSPAAQRFRQSNTGVARSGVGAGTPSSGARRPQAAAPPAPTSLPRPSGGRRGSATDLNEVEPATSVETADWGEKEIAVDDSQLVDWQTDVGSANAITGDDDFSDLGRKR